jgi:hypothetical protein
MPSLVIPEAATVVWIAVTKRIMFGDGDNVNVVGFTLLYRTTVALKSSKRVNNM